MLREKLQSFTDGALAASADTGVFLSVWSTCY